jgi:hypothetical protein
MEKAMTVKTVTIARSRVLGTFNSRCDVVEMIPVFLSDDMNNQIGFVDQSMGPYADAFSFHLPEDMCKKLSTGQFTFSFGYDKAKNGANGQKPRITLNYICLNARESVS